MAEKIKTAILLLLVCSSLFLTHQLWYGQSPAQPLAEDIYERIEVESPRPMEEIVTPSRIIVYQGNSAYQFRLGEEDFNSLWDINSTIMQDYENFTVANEDTVPDSLSTFAAFYFKPPLPVGSDQPWLPGMEYLPVDIIKIKTYENDYWLILYENATEAELTFNISAEQVEPLLIAISDLQNLDRISYIELTDNIVTDLVEGNLSVRSSLYVPQDPVYLSNIMLDPEVIDRDNLLRSFFVDLNLARVIEEKEDGLIYTDGEKGLRITTKGLAYSAPRLEEGQTTISYPEALLNCSNLISHHGGWPDDLRLEDFTYTSRNNGSNYTASWQKYYSGYPLITKMPTRLSFNDRGLIHYSRSIYSPAAPLEEELFEAASWSEALKTAISIIALEHPGSESDLRVERIQLVYVVSGSSSAPLGVPAWQLIINGENIYLDAQTLEPFQGEKL